MNEKSPGTGDAEGNAKQLSRMSKPKIKVRPREIFGKFLTSDQSGS